MRVGGGTSIMPRVAPTLREFVTADDGEYLKVAEAVFRVFDRQEWLRKNRARARIKVFVDKFGIEELAQPGGRGARGRLGRRARLRPRAAALHRRRGGRRARRSPRPTRARTATAASSSAGAPRASSRSARPGSRPCRSRWCAATSRPSSSAASPRSCATTRAATAAPRSTRTWCCAGCATRPSYEVWRALSELGLGDAGVDEINDVVSCPGTDSCKLGITSSMGLNHAVRERIESMGIEDPLTRRIHIKMSGCPNGCSQHHIANIGFYGASIKVGEHTIPAYVAHIGGNYEGGEVLYGTRLKVRLPAKRVPDAVERWVRMYEAERKDGEAFNDFAERVGGHPLRGRGPRPVDAGRVQPREHAATSSTGSARSPSRSSGVRANARCRPHRRGDAPDSPSSGTIRRSSWPAPSRRRSRS